MSSVQYSFSAPVSFNGAEIGSVTIREATVGDYLAAEDAKHPMEWQATLIARMINQPLEFLKSLTKSEFDRLAKAADPLLGNEPPATTGAGSQA